MKNTELRIGNLTNKGIIKDFYEGGIHVGYGKCFKFSEISPVNLTHEKLIEFGFIALSFTSVTSPTITSQSHKSVISYI